MIIEFQNIYKKEEIFNDDDNLNVLDVIIIVNMALGNTEIDLNGDMNGDNGVNILDVVLLVNIILNN